MVVRRCGRCGANRAKHNAAKRIGKLTATVTGEMTEPPPSFEEIRRKAIADLAAAHPEVLAS
jgi:hypothetical protein